MEALVAIIMALVSLFGGPSGGEEVKQSPPRFTKPTTTTTTPNYRTSAPPPPEVHPTPEVSDSDDGWADDEQRVWELRNLGSCEHPWADECAPAVHWYEEGI